MTECKKRRKIMGMGYVNGVYGYEIMSSAVCIFLIST